MESPYCYPNEMRGIYLYKDDDNLWHIRGASEEGKLLDIDWAFNDLELACNEATTYIKMFADHLCENSDESEVLDDYNDAPDNPF